MKNYLLSILILLMFLCSLEFFSRQLLVQHVEWGAADFQSVKRLDLTQLRTFQGQNMFNHFTLSAFWIYDLSALIHHHPPVLSNRLFSLCRSCLCSWANWVWFHHKPKVRSPCGAQRVQSGCAALNGRHSYAGGHYQWLDQPSVH